MVRNWLMKLGCNIDMKSIEILKFIGVLSAFPYLKFRAKNRISSERQAFH
jgi:hypothetical protein